MTPTATAPGVDTTPLGFHLLDLATLTDFPLNPREHWGDMAALETSVRAQGVLEPILVRRAGAKFQVIAGARRVKAARAAKLPTVPAVVREATDTQALEIALTENSNRHDVHRLNEAIAIQSLMKLDTAYTPGVVAAKLGRPEKYIRETLKLLSLEPAPRKAYAADQITAGHAVLLARLPKERQTEGLEQCFGRLWTGDGHDRVLKSVKGLEAWIRDSVPLELASPSQETRDLFPDAVKLAGTGTAIVQVYRGYGDVKRKGSKDIILGEGSWKKAGPRDDCGRAGVIVLGADKGQIVRVCIDRECAKHFPKPKATPASTRSASSAKADRKAAAKARAAQKAKAESAARKRALEARIVAALVTAAAETVSSVTPALARIVFEELILDYGELETDELAAVFSAQTGLKAARYGSIAGDPDKLTDRQVARGLVVGLLARQAYNRKGLEKVVRGAFKVDPKKVAGEVERAAKLEAKEAAKAAAAPKAPAKKGGRA